MKKKKPYLALCKSQATSLCKVFQQLMSIRQLPVSQWTLILEGKSEKYSSLALLAKETLGVPPSSSAVERVFSIAGKGFTPERSIK